MAEDDRPKMGAKSRKTVRKTNVKHSKASPNRGTIVKDKKGKNVRGSTHKKVKPPTKAKKKAVRKKTNPLKKIFKSKRPKKRKEKVGGITAQAHTGQTTKPQNSATGQKRTTSSSNKKTRTAKSTPRARGVGGGGIFQILRGPTPGINHRNPAKKHRLF